MRSARLAQFVLFTLLITALAVAQPVSPTSVPAPTVLDLSKPVETEPQPPVTSPVTAQPTDSTPPTADSGSDSDPAAVPAPANETASQPTESTVETTELSAPVTEPQPTEAAKPIDPKDVKFPSMARQAGEHRYAICVGINDYADTAVPDLTLSVDDAKFIQLNLTDSNLGNVPEQKTRVLTEEVATVEQFREALQDLKLAPEASKVFIYFSGHIAVEGTQAYMMMHNSSFSNLSSTGMSDQEFKAILNEIPASDVLVMIDACWNGEAARRQSSSVFGFSRLVRRFATPHRAFILGTHDGRESMSGLGHKHSVLTYYLLRGLLGPGDKNRDGTLDLGEFTRYVYHHVVVQARVRKGTEEVDIRMDGIRNPATFEVASYPKPDTEEKVSEELKTKERLDELFKLYRSKKITPDQYETGKELLETDPAGLSRVDSAVRKPFESLADGTLDPKHLEGAVRIAKETVDAQVQTAANNLAGIDPSQPGLGIAGSPGSGGTRLGGSSGSGGAGGHSAGGTSGGGGQDEGPVSSSGGGGGSKSGGKAAKGVRRLAPKIPSPKDLKPKKHAPNVAEESVFTSLIVMGGIIFAFWVLIKIGIRAGG